MLHFSHKYGNVDDNGYQYCQICNKAHFVKKDCQHKFQIIKEIKVNEYDTIVRIIYVNRCENCGILFNHESN